MRRSLYQHEMLQQSVQAQQIFETPTENDIADRSVIMTWPAGEAATTVRVYVDDNLVKEQPVTADEVNEGKVVVTGLEPETAYTIRLYNGEKQRGSKDITTIADLNGATLVHEGDDKPKTWSSSLMVPPTAHSELWQLVIA